MMLYKRRRRKKKKKNDVVESFSVVELKGVIDGTDYYST